MSSFPKDLCIDIHAPLNELDTVEQTFGCRQANPDICKFCFLDGVCAFVSSDKICKHPSAKWKKIYKELKEQS